MLVARFKKNNLILFLLLLLSVHLYGLSHRISAALYDVYDLIGLLVFVVLFVEVYLFNKSLCFDARSRLFDKLILLFFFALFLSVFSCFFYHGQNFLLTLLAMREFAFFSVFLFLIRVGVSAKYVEKLICWFALIYAVVFVLQYLLFPFELVPLGRIEGFDRGFLRVRVEGVGFLTLYAFMMLNKFIQNPARLRYLLYYFGGFVLVFMLGFRTLLLKFLVSYLIMVLLVGRSFGKKLFAFVFSSLLIIGVLFMTPVYDVVIGYLELSREQLNSQDEYIRFQTYDFLFNQVNVDFITLLFGNGKPVESSSYGGLVLGMGVDRYGYISADIGIFGFIFKYGLIAFILYLLIIMQAFFSKTDKSSKYLNVFFLYLIISSVTTSELYRAGMYGVQSVVLYLICQNVYKNSFNRV